MSDGQRVSTKPLPDWYKRHIEEYENAKETIHDGII